MQDSPLAAIAMIVGLVLMATGYFIPSLVPTQAVWTNEQALEFSQAASKWHSASYAGHDHSKGAGHVEADHKSPEYLAAKAAYEKSAQALNQALARREWYKYGLIAAGVLFAGVGIGSVCLAKLKEDDHPRRRH